MKRFIYAAAVATAVLAAPAHAGVSISIGQPGFYGRVDIGGYPAPALIYPQPVVIHPAPVAGPPLYLRVPPGHARNWRRYCNRYGACGQPVYFVRDEWYLHEYAPRYREQHYHEHYYERERRHEWRHGHRRGHGDD